MLFSKANLTVRQVAATNPQDRTLNCVHFSADGATVASNGRTLLAVGPVDESRVHFPPVEGNANPPAIGISVPLDIVADAVSNLPKDKKTSLQNVKLTGCTLDRVEFTTSNLTKEKRVAGQPIRERFPEWAAIIRKAKTNASSGRIVLPRKDFITLLAAMDDAADDGEEGAVFIEFGTENSGLVLRSINPKTGQDIIGLAIPMKTGGSWVQGTSWIKKILGLIVNKIAR